MIPPSLIYDYAGRSGGMSSNTRQDNSYRTRLPHCTGPGAHVRRALSYSTLAHLASSTLIYPPVTDKKRAKSAGSQYGKQIPHKKPVKVDEPTFQPELVNKGISAKIREQAKSKIYDQAKKAAVRWRGVVLDQRTVALQWRPPLVTAQCPPRPTPAYRVCAVVITSC